ncbi:hypothetical protein AVEN_266180-1 [Araneus ventricosus]|uniref:Uncharacterized protein n=1 Tax=Araneus ventricosus TaxID=182803 RepID=A0A4Y2BPI4_ARAVE|nr:hypothetical protein AVEN_266180-1 [Araneus ventricosus]
MCNDIDYICCIKLGCYATSSLLLRFIMPCTNSRSIGNDSVHLVLIKLGYCPILTLHLINLDALTEEVSTVNANAMASYYGVDKAGVAILTRL